MATGARRRSGSSPTLRKNADGDVTEDDFTAWLATYTFSQVAKNVEMSKKLEELDFRDEPLPDLGWKSYLELHALIEERPGIDCRLRGMPAPECVLVAPDRYHCVEIARHEVAKVHRKSELSSTAIGNYDDSAARLLVDDLNGFGTI